MPILLAVVLLAAFGSVLARSEPRLTGTNSVPLRAPVIGLSPNEQLCQPGQILPADSARVRIFLAPVGKGPPQTLVTIKQGGKVIARGRGRYNRRGLIDVPFEPVRRTRLDATVCLRNLAKEQVALSGINTPFGNVVVDGKTLQSAVTVLWFAEGERSWFSQLATMAPRVGHARLGAGWVFWVGALLSLLSVGIALAVTIRESRA